MVFANTAFTNALFANTEWHRHTRSDRSSSCPLVLLLVRAFTERAFTEGAFAERASSYQGMPAG
jgi:hypothetical protein